MAKDTKKPKKPEEPKKQFPSIKGAADKLKDRKKLNEKYLNMSSKKSGTKKL